MAETMYSQADYVRDDIYRASIADPQASKAFAALADLVKDMAARIDSLQRQIRRLESRETTCE